MTKKELFTKAHEMTRKIKAEYPEINYRAQFSICLKALTEKKENTNEIITMNNLLPKQNVELNGFTREVAIKIEGNKMFGLINKSRFIWDYTNNELPIVEVKPGADKLKAAKYGRLYILKRLEQANLNLPIKTKNRNVNYITLEKSNGVWINCFKNGYMRGAVDGVPFTWDPSKYSRAAVVTEPGFKGSIKHIVDTDRIKARLKEAGFNTLGELKRAIV